MNPLDRYSIKTKEKTTKPGCWNHLQVEILENDKIIGSYLRNYPSIYNTFVPFTRQNKDYALYSKDYVCTSVMSLPDCKEIASEKGSSFGFCPVDFFIPEYPEEPNRTGDFGFVAGCIWGDDSSWKVQLLDLRAIEQGILKRINFNYHELPDKSNSPLKNSFNKDNFYIEDEDDIINITFDFAAKHTEHTVSLPK
jgi:hypothetical protein